MVPLSNLITTLVVVRNGVPKMKGLFSSSLMSKITKSTGYTCSATSTNMSSAIPKGYIYNVQLEESLILSPAAPFVGYFEASSDVLLPCYFFLRIAS
ncbi:hypothetical protein Tco_0553735 [Tanacetum coccineum]